MLINKNWMKIFDWFSLDYYLFIAILTKRLGYLIFFSLDKVHEPRLFLTKILLSMHTSIIIFTFYFYLEKRLTVHLLGYFMLPLSLYNPKGVRHSIMEYNHSKYLMYNRKERSKHRRMLLVLKGFKKSLLLNVLYKLCLG